jgi:aminoglycoside phosphotransferase family enzyme/predicted kinase
MAAESVHADVSTLRRSLAEGGRDVRVRETHCSTVFLVGDRAYKLRKPVRFDFADQRAPEARADICRREVALNAALAPGVALGVRTVLPAPEGDGYALGDDGDPRAVDHLVEMRRFDEADTLRSRILSGRVARQDAVAIGARMAVFHCKQVAVAPAVDYRALVDRNFEALLPLIRDLVPAGELLGLQREASAFLLGWADVLEARAANGLVVDGHGDLRAEHVLLEHDGVLVVDRLDLDEFRVLDVADELGFLLMELRDLTGADVLGDAVLAGYRSAGGAGQPDALLAFFGAYRAQVRAKVALLRARQPGADPGLRKQALRLLTLSRRLGWRARGPMLILVTGPPASGKSTLATALGEASGFPVVSSDAVRREWSRGAPDYGPAGRAAIYAELGGRVARERGAIVDATFGSVALQDAFLRQLAAVGASPPLVVECRAPTEVREARARLRQQRGGSLSDAGPEVAARLGEQYVPMGAAQTEAQLAVDTRAAVASQVDEVASWLDSLVAGGRSV